MISQAQITAWAAGESEILEFKKSTAEKDRACRTLCAFANSQGGRLLFGVAGREPPTVLLRPGAVVLTFGLPVGTPGKTPGKAPGKKLGKTELAVLRLLGQEPELTAPQIAARVGKSESAVHRAIRALRESGLVRVGTRKAGHWQVLE